MRSGPSLGTIATKQRVPNKHTTQNKHIIQKHKPQNFIFLAAVKKIWRFWLYTAKQSIRNKHAAPNIRSQKHKSQNFIFLAAVNETWSFLLTYIMTKQNIPNRHTAPNIHSSEKHENMIFRCLHSSSTTSGQLYMLWSSQHEHLMFWASLSGILHACTLEL